ncbi:hypothetical protein N5D77_22605 [Comamonas thiooxydans]|uniref:Uncharacterized protein n=1 Tax=Comamonas thiooxydans TaxID=363952 RepID=A0AA42Q4F8_9BURK|nr:hypothetical protein [Comamonas thiooxydans]MDH1336849.1 hypothetical protein [Comamonas thiooxydans]MDH1743786.1 hypothetical protein [Comamonas thiooxydans]MDH1789372.1 hypothetical protein [Comamonas thiooxydans]
MATQATQGFLARVSGKTKQLFGLAVSAGAADGGKLVATDSAGKLDMSLMPVGIGANTIIALASEAIGAGKFVNFYSNAGAMNVRLADNSNGRQADGYVKDAVANAASATVYPLDTTNTALAGLTPGGRYWLGTAGGVIAAALDATDVDNAGKVCQELGVAKSATELVTDDLGFVVL